MRVHNTGLSRILAGCCIKLENNITRSLHSGSDHSTDISADKYRQTWLLQVVCSLHISEIDQGQRNAVQALTPLRCGPDMEEVKIISHISRP